MGWQKGQKQSAAARERIQTARLVDMLQASVFGEITLSKDQLKGIEVLLRKTLPDLTGVELSGPDGGAIEYTYTERIARIAAIFEFGAAERARLAAPERVVATIAGSTDGGAAKQG